MKNSVKKTTAAVLLALVGVSAAGCKQQADVASKNLSTAADNFQIARKITFYNGITGQDILVVTGFCSLGNNDPAGQLSVTCKVGPNAYVKDFLGLSDNVTYLAEQLTGADVSTTQYDVVWTPQQIIPNIHVK